MSESTITKSVSVYYSEQEGCESGWVARCTERDEGGPIMGRIAMDEPIDYCDDAESACEYAAKYYGVDVDDVTVSE